MEEDQLIVLKKDEILNSPMASEYVKRVNDLLKAEMAETVKLIEKSKETIQAIADVLIKENKLTGAEFEGLMRGE